MYPLPWNEKPIEISATFAQKKSKLNLNRVKAEYSLGSDEGSRDGLRLVPAEDPGEAKVGNLGVHVGVEQDVAGLEILAFMLTHCAQSWCAEGESQIM
jgi:hypothetical protein